MSDSQVRQTSVPKVLQDAHAYARAARTPGDMRDSAEGPLCRPNEPSMMQVDRDDFACDPAYSNGDCSTSGDYTPSHARGQSITSSERSLDIRAKAVLRVETMSRRSLKVRHCPSVRSLRLPPIPSSITGSNLRCCRDSPCVSSSSASWSLLHGWFCPSCPWWKASIASMSMSTLHWQQAWLQPAWQFLDLPCLALSGV
jgi:hypothetical protein